MIQADSNGVVNGSFDVPPNIPVGTKSVVFVGDTGALARTTYTGSGTITTRQLRTITDITTTDPLAQTFTLPESRLLAGLDIWFTYRGENDVRLQIRETVTGIPNQVILSETIKKTGEITTDGTPTEFRFDPILVTGGVEYAIVVMTDDPNYRVRIAELSKRDKIQYTYVRRQPYQVGVLLSSSNASTWTPHNEIDLTFRLLAARFTNTTRVVQCGTITAADTSDFMALASVERPNSETDVRFVVTKPATETEPARTFEVLDNQVLNLDDRVTGELQVEAHLSGSEKFSPVLLPGLQMAQGNLLETADYVTRAVSCDGAGTLKITLDGQFSGQSGVDVYRETAVTDEWQQITGYVTESAGDGWMERTYEETGLSQNMVRVKLVLRGNPEDRPRVRNLRVITI